MSALLVILGILVGLLAGVAVAILLTRASRERMQETLRAISEQEREQLREQLSAASEQAREHMRDEMKAISSDVLRQTGDSLAQRLAEQRRAEEERISGEMRTRAEQLKGLMAPLNEKLGKVEGEIGRLERERKQAQGELANMVRQLHEGVGSLRQETGNLVSALKRPSTRGSWGEIQLRNVIEMAGMVSHCDFVEQSTVQSTEGASLRPDVLVRLPGGKVVVIDSKVPLDAYLAHLEATDEQEKQLQLARHGRQTREHITKLASKGYQRQFDSTPELVVMFIPSDGIYHAALAADPSLIEYGVHQQVLMATPTTLIGLLRAIHYGWRQEQIARSAKEIADAARELHRRLGRFVDPLSKVGRQLGSAVAAYNEAVGSFDRRVVPQVRRIEQAGAGSERQIEAPEALEGTPRSVTASIEAPPDADADALSSAPDADAPAAASAPAAGAAADALASPPARDMLSSAPDADAPAAASAPAAGADALTAPQAGSTPS